MAQTLWVCESLCASELTQSAVSNCASEIVSGHGFSRAVMASIPFPLPLSQRERGDHVVVGEGRLLPQLRLTTNSRRAKLGITQGKREISSATIIQARRAWPVSFCGISDCGSAAQRVRASGAMARCGITKAQAHSSERTWPILQTASTARNEPGSARRLRASAERIRKRAGHTGPSAARSSH